MKKVVVFGSGYMALEISRELINYGLHIMLFIQQGSLNLTSEDIDKIDIIYDYDISLLEPNDFSDVRYIIEASGEQYDNKVKIMNSLKRVVTDRHIIIVHTLAHSITLLASQAKFPQSVMGVQFVPRITKQEKIVAISTSMTSKDSLEAVKELSLAINKDIVFIEDSPGGIVGTALISFIIEAIRILEEGDLTAESIDKIVVLGMNLPKGPLQLADEIGLDTVKFCMEQLYNQTKLNKYRPSKRLNDMVFAGYLGCMSQRGFYQY